MSIRCRFDVDRREKVRTSTTSQSRSEERQNKFTSISTSNRNRSDVLFWADGPGSGGGGQQLLAPDDGEVRHLEGAGPLAASLQGPRHAVAHVEVRRAHPGGQAQLQHITHHTAIIGRASKAVVGETEGQRIARICSNSTTFPLFRRKSETKVR